MLSATRAPGPKHWKKTGATEAPGNRDGNTVFPLDTRMKIPGLPGKNSSIDRRMEEVLASIDSEQ
jgi:hypothetical protein